MSSILIALLDTNISSLPIYKELEKLKFKVYVIGKNENEGLAKLCKNFIKQDYSDINKIIDTLAKNKINFIMPGCNDVSLKACSEIANRIENIKKNINIDSPENVNILINKLLFKNFAIKNKIPVAQLFQINNSNQIEKNLLIKPVDSFSGKGINEVTKKSSKNIINKKINEALNFSSSKDYVIEEYFHGQLYSHSCFIQNNKIIFECIVKEFCFTNKFTVDTSFVSKIEKKILNEIQLNILKISKKLNLKSGLMHSQFLYNSSTKKFIFVEITRRSPGDLYSELINMTYGFNYANYYVSSFLGKRLVKKNIKQRDNIIRHTISDKNFYYFSTINFMRSVIVKAFYPLIDSFSKVNPAPFGKSAIIFLEYKNKKNADKLCSLIKNNKLYKIRD